MKKLIYINGPAPTEKQKKEAKEKGASFRNAKLISDKVEQCDEVALPADVKCTGYEKTKKLDLSKDFYKVEEKK